MKEELIEYHRGRQRFNALRATDWPEDSPERRICGKTALFHQRAVAWLESLDEGPALSAAVERQIQRENLKRLNEQVNG